MSSVSQNAEVITVILTALAKTSMRTNKLRKIVCNKECKDLKLTWTDYQEIVDKLVKDAKVVEKILEDGAKELSLAESLSSSSSSAPSSSSKPSAPESSKEEKSPKKKRKESEAITSSSSSAVEPIPASFTATRSEKIPVKVALHLLKQEGKKKRNIEINTKTRLLIKGDFEGNATATLEIYAEESKRLDAAMVFVTKFRQAYKKNPDHFEGDKGKKKSEGKKRQRKFY